MKREELNSVKVVQRNGITVRIRSTPKDGITRFVVDFRNQGKRKLVWRSSLADARAAANEAIDKITEGQAEVLNLKSAEAHAYVRARTALDGIEKEIDAACEEYGDAYRLLAGRATVGEAVRDWLKRHAVELPRVSVAEAVDQLMKQSAQDGKSELRLKQLTNVLNRFAQCLNVDVHTLTSRIVADHLTALPLAERSRRNHRDVIGFFNRWLITRGYLAKGTDWLEGVQNYSAGKLGEISTYTADEMRRLIAGANEKILPMIVIGGFAGLRHAEITRLDWQDIYLDEGFIEVKAQHAKTNVRRTVPIKENLKKFLQMLAKKDGKVITVVNTGKLLVSSAANTGDAKRGIAPLVWKHNALRHTYISARVAECADVARVADEAGNSPQIVKTNYLKRIRPAAAAEWFAIQPLESGKRL